MLNRFLNNELFRTFFQAVKNKIRGTCIQFVWFGTSQNTFMNRSNHMSKIQISVLKCDLTCGWSVRFRCKLSAPHAHKAWETLCLGCPKVWLTFTFCPTCTITALTQRYSACCAFTLVMSKYFAQQRDVTYEEAKQFAEENGK